MGQFAGVSGYGSGGVNGQWQALAYLLSGAGHVAGGAAFRADTLLINIRRYLPVTADPIGAKAASDQR